MRFNFLGGGEARPEPDNTITHIDVWFDLYQTKVWWVTFYNKDGLQVGDSVDYAHKKDAEACAKERKASLLDHPSISVGKRDGGY